MIYFAQPPGGGPIKIGYTADAARLNARLAVLRSSCPFPVRITRTIAHGTRTDERALHQRFAQHRMHGEWFYPADEVAREAHAAGEDTLRATAQAAARLLA